MSGIHRFIEHDLTEVSNELIDGHRVCRNLTSDRVTHVRRGPVPRHGEVIVKPIEQLGPDIESLLAKGTGIRRRPVESAFGLGPLNVGHGIHPSTNKLANWSPTGQATPPADINATDVPARTERMSGNMDGFSR